MIDEDRKTEDGNHPEKKAMVGSYISTFTVHVRDRLRSSGLDHTQGIQTELCTLSSASCETKMNTGA